MRILFAYLTIAAIIITSCSKPHVETLSPDPVQTDTVHTGPVQGDSILVLSQAGQLHFEYTNDSLPVRVGGYSLYYSQDKLDRLVMRSNAGPDSSKQAIILSYENGNVSKVFSKQTVYSYDPLYADPTYEFSTSLDGFGVKEYDSLVWQNNKLTAKYHFLRSWPNHFYLTNYEKIFYKANDQRLVDRAELYYDSSGMGFRMMNYIVFVNYDSAKVNPLNKTFKELAYLSSSAFFDNTIPVYGADPRIDNYSALSPFVLKSAVVRWSGAYGWNYSLFDFTNIYSAGNIESTSLNSLTLGETITFEYLKIPH